MSIEKIVHSWIDFAKGDLEAAEVLKKFFYGFKKINLKKVIKGYLKNFPKDFKVEKIFLFGSYATGKITKDSDVDLIVISPLFKGMSFVKRLELLSRLREGLAKKVAMDILGYTPEEFKIIDKESIIMKQAKREGRIIYKKQKAYKE